MVEQKIVPYMSKKVHEITRQIERDSKMYGMPVKTISLTSQLYGATTYYDAIVVFEEEGGNE